MAHGMTNEDKMFAVRVAPWHMGQTNSVVLDDHPSIDDVLIHAGLNWEIETGPIFRQNVRDLEVDGTAFQAVTYPTIPGYKTITRSDTGHIITVARETWTPVQNRECAEILEALLQSDGAVKYDTGGSYGGGAVCYLSALLNEPFQISGDDSVIHPYVSVNWAHDGSGAVNARSTNVRQVCANTVSLAEAESRSRGTNFTFRHTKNVRDRIADAKLVIQGLRADADGFRDIAEELAAIVITDAQREEFILRFVPEPAADVVSARVRENVRVARAQVRHVFDTATMPDVHRNTAYGLVLAGGEYLDHLRGYRNQGTYLGRTLLREEPLKSKLVTLARKVAVS